MPTIPPLKATLRILSGDDVAMGPGKADLLDAIERTGSIAAAGRDLGMSYRRTWLLVDLMNRSWVEPLVAATPGGGSRKGTRLTPCGHRVLAAYRDMEQQVMRTATGSPAFNELRSLVLPVPRPSQDGSAPDDPSRED